MGVVQHPDIVRAVQLIEHTHQEHSRGVFSLSTLRGRLTEFICSPASPTYSLISLLLREAQIQKDSVVWISCSGSVFFPPDMKKNGIDLSALPVVWAKNVRSAVRVCEHLLRSNGFGFLVVDLPEQALVEQGRLGKLARLSDLHNTAVLFVTRHNGRALYSLGSMISLRFEASRENNKNKFTCKVRAVKEKCRAPGWIDEKTFNGPDGMY